ncbi:hypothetical protein RF11_04923 [Thelohanellus kitauei]|uniref:Uncharacterized protein n=1 Tax=Thelohanellus kitauei TaxID=669202 RepID=A0A0C2NEB8_THEKT|nr:hypothetical protein RF11_04923 [Thelohanellus kitauei]
MHLHEMVKELLDTSFNLCRQASLINLKYCPGISYCLQNSPIGTSADLHPYYQDEEELASSKCIFVMTMITYSDTTHNALECMKNGRLSEFKTLGIQIHMFKYHIEMFHNKRSTPKFQQARMQYSKKPYNRSTIGKPKDILNKSGVPNTFKIIHGPSKDE